MHPTEAPPGTQHPTLGLPRPAPGARAPREAASPPGGPAAWRLAVASLFFGLAFTVGALLALPGVVLLLPWLRRLPASQAAGPHRDRTDREPPRPESDDSRPRGPALVMTVPPPLAAWAEGVWPAPARRDS
jgi:hypothetical protein